jgi:ABC-type phosphate transport system permease subunit
MSARRLLRIVLSLLIVAVVWIRAGREWQSRSGSWLAGAITLSAILILVVIADITGALQKSRRSRDEVPKRPLGLDI